MGLICIVSQNSKQTYTLTLEDSYYFSERKLIKASPIVLEFYEDTLFVGFVEFDIRVFNKNSYITFYVSAEVRGKGYGKRMLEFALSYARNEMNLHRLTAEVYEYNIPSIKLLESVGFELEGRLREAKYHEGRYWDILVFGKILNT
uniref:N-acetyltransferase n=1 Tax=Fervidobacterium thailandense TaxID=1008305 RepID=A0A7C5RIP4_9BACT